MEEEGRERVGCRRNSVEVCGWGQELVLGGQK